MWTRSKPLKNPTDKKHAYEYAVFLLNASLRTEREVQEKMQRRGYHPDTIGTVISELKSLKFINDENYTELFIDNMKRFKFYGMFMMKKKLMEKKVPMPIIEKQLAELVSEEDEYTIAKRYVEKNFGKLSEVRQLAREEKQKIMSRLLTRGFRVDTIKSLIG